jgi:AAA family ATP:ADP antiporter
MSSTESEKTSWAKKVWPISRAEYKKVLPLLLIKFLVSLVYSILTLIKDPLVVTASHSGAEVIPVLKGWVVFPLSILCAIGYSKLSNLVKRSTLFYTIISAFLVIIFLYGFVLYPNMSFLTPSDSANWLTAQFGAKYTHWIAVYRNWIHSIFFVTTELWGQVVIFLLYWGFTNHICQVKEAKRTYTLFIAAGDIAAILAGPLTYYYGKKFLGQNYLFTLQSLLGYVLIAGILIMVVYWWMNRYVLTDKRYYNPDVMKQTVNQKTKLSLKDSLKHIFSSKYLLSIAVLVIGCALTINMVEVTWKAHLKTLYPTTVDYQMFMGRITTIVGFVALITVFFLGGNFLRRFGWHFSAQITPWAVGITGGVFFLLCLLKPYLGPFAHYIGLTPLMIIVLFGAFQNIVSKVVKYSFFDSTKEMAYIPLDPESKVKGKAAIDMVGSRLGKSSSSWLQIGLIELVGTGSVISITPYLLPIVLGVALYWSYSVRYLNKELPVREEGADAEQQKESDLQAAEPTPS